jgi:hypothetical protein
LRAAERNAPREDAPRGNAAGPYGTPAANCLTFFCTLGA